LILEEQIKNKENKMEKITRTFTITAPEDVMERFERFLALMHFNAGHTATFCMPFDGDGADTLRVTPSVTLEKYKEDSQKIAHCGPEFEIAGDNCYRAVSGDYTRGQYRVINGKTQRYNRENDEYTDLK
jgi:hypothetical protein